MVLEYTVAGACEVGAEVGAETAAGGAPRALPAAEEGEGARTEAGIGIEIAEEGGTEAGTTETEAGRGPPGGDRDRQGRCASIRVTVTYRISR